MRMLKAGIAGRDGIAIIEMLTAMAIFGATIKDSGANVTVDPAAYPTVA